MECGRRLRLDGVQNVREVCDGKGKAVLGSTPGVRRIDARRIDE
jgi:hypothetical protein